MGVSPKIDTWGMRTVSVCTMRIQLSSLVPARNVDQGEVAYTCHLDIVRGLDEVRSGDGSVRHQARAIPRLDTPRDLNPLRVTNNRVRTWLRWCEHTEVVYRVDCEANESDCFHLGTVVL